MKKKKKKKGVSEILIMIILLLLAIPLLAIAFTAINSIVKKQAEIFAVKEDFLDTNMQIRRVVGNLSNPSTINITIYGGTGTLVLKNLTTIEKYGDIVFLIDTTESMGEEKDDMKDTIIEFANRLEQESINYRLGLIEFRDYPEDPCGISGDFPSKIHTFSEGQFTTNATEYKEEIESINVGGGADLPESHLQAISDAINLNYREDAKKINIMLTDAPPHAKDCLFPTEGMLDIVLVNDRSGSMRQSGWTLNKSVPHSYFFGDVNVPGNDYSSSYKFNVSAGTETLNL